MSYDPQIGDVWKSAGPVGAMKVVRRMWPGFPEYDGGVPGCSIGVTDIDGGEKVFFFLCKTPDDFVGRMKEDFKELQEVVK